MCTANHTILIHHFSISSAVERRVIAPEVVGSNPTLRTNRKLAQLVEHQTHNLTDTGSNPVLSTPPWVWAPRVGRVS